VRGAGTAGAHECDQESERGQALAQLTFSAMMRSPTSKVGNMESEGMKRGSAMNHRKTSESAKARNTVLASSDVRLIQSGSQEGCEGPEDPSSGPLSPCRPWVPRSFRRHRHLLSRRSLP